MAPAIPDTTIDVSRLTPREARQLFRNGSFSGPTAGFSAGYLQANLVVVPLAGADAFENYCDANPRHCPLLERLAPGDPQPQRTAPGADLRSDLPRYRSYRRERGDQHLDVRHLWRDDAVAFLLGCSFTFETALGRVGLVPRHVEERRNVPMYRTDRATSTRGPFEGQEVVSMRPIAAGRVEEAYEVTAPYVAAHGAPIHHGDPAALGIADLSRPDWGDAVTVRPGEVPVFWACGVTSQVAVEWAVDGGAIAWAITHHPGHMFITDLSADCATRPRL